MKKIFFFILYSFCFTSYAQQFETGKIIDSLFVEGSDHETYTLYLPTGYDASKKSPILFVFSPSGNGKKGIKTFVKSAEAYNYILVCSNNSRNGFLEQNLNITQRLFNHIFSNFDILENRVYLAGFSGGARLASAIASASDGIDGVVACGSGFMSDPNYIPSIQNFSYVGLCGDQDMNYQEMLNVRSYLNKVKIHNTLFTFDGGHKWPPNEQLLMAFNWLEIEAFKKRRIEKPKEEIKELYINDFKKAQTIEKSKQPLVASEYYERIINTYNSFFSLDSVRLKLQNIKKSKDYSNTWKARKQAFEKEVILNSFFLKHFDKDYKNSKNINLTWWNKEFEKLKKEESKANLQVIKMHKRVLFKILATAYTISNNNANISEQQQSFCDAIISLIISQQKK